MSITPHFRLWGVTTWAVVRETGQDNPNPSHSTPLFRSEDNLDYSNLVYPDRRYGSETWASTAGTFHFGKEQTASNANAALALKRDTAVFSSSYRLGGPSMALPGHGDELAAYRATWQNDARGRPAIEERFTTAVHTATGGSSVPARFQPNTFRVRPGATSSVDFLVQRLVSARGVDALLRFALALPQTLDKFVLRGALTRAGGVKISIDEEKELIRGLGAEWDGGSFSAGELVCALAQPIQTIGPRADAVTRAWSAITATASLRTEAEPTLASFSAAADGAAHPDAKGKVPMRTPAAAALHMREGLVAAARWRAAGGSLTNPGYHLSIKEPSGAENLDADPLSSSVVRGNADSLRSPSRAPKIVAATMCSSVFPLAMSRRVANSDFLNIGGKNVGVPGEIHRDVAAGGIRRARTDDADAPTDDSPAENGVRVAAALSAPASDALPISLKDFELWLSFISSAIPLDDTFSRFCDGAFHASVSAHVVASHDRRDPPSRTVPPRSKGAPTSSADFGSGLRFASRPFDPMAVKDAPPRPVSKFDADLAAAQIKDTHALVLVTRASGSKEVLKIVIDRFFNDGKLTEEELLVRARVVCPDATDATIDFA